jgi:NAD(P)-dependent dehydrogenase (short-subunit alcohol dehydrogenase family)
MSRTDSAVLITGAAGGIGTATVRRRAGADALDAVPAARGHAREHDRPNVRAVRDRPPGRGEVVSRTVAVVGATAGLGREAVHRLAAAGHRVIAVGRDPQKAAALRRDLPAATVIAGDVSTADGVTRVARHIRAHTDHLDTLVNNAGVMPNKRRVTGEGVELNFAVHHLAPFTLTGSLLPLLHAGDGRVVNVNSAGHAAPIRGTGPVELRLDDMQHEQGYDPFMAYSRSKLANLLFTYELARRHPELTVVAVHPGVVRTSLGRDFPRPLVGGYRGRRSQPDDARLALGPGGKHRLQLVLQQREAHLVDRDDGLGSPR